MANRKQYEIALAIGGKVNSSLGRAIGNANKQLYGLQKGIKTMAGVAAGYLSLNAVKNFASESEQAAKDQIQQETKLEAILKNVRTLQAQGPEAYRKATAELVGLASNLQNVGVIGDDVALAGYQQLATFQLSNKEISNLSTGMADLLAQQKGMNATSEDAVSVAQMMGKVMDGNVGALKRVGISFTEAQENALKTGDSVQRAAVLAEVLKNNVGGVNAALRDTDDGKIWSMKNAWSEMQEEIGRKILPLHARFAGWFSTMIPGIQSGILRTFDLFSSGIDSAVKVFDRVRPYIDRFRNNILNMKPAFQQVFNIVKQVVVPVIEKLSGVFRELLQNRIMLIKSQLASISKAFSNVWPYIKQFGQVLADTFNKIMPSVVEFVKKFDETIIKIWPVILNVFEFVGKKIIPIVSDAFAFLGQEVIPMVVGAFTEWLPRIANIVQNLWNIVRPVLSVVIAYIKYLFPYIQGIVLAAITSIKGIIGGLLQALDGIISFISGVFAGDWAKAWQGVKDIFGGIFGTLGALLKTPINVIIGMINGVIKNINRLDINIPEWVPVIGGKGFNVNIPQMPMLASGAYIKHRPGGIVANIGEGREDEVISPLSRLEKILGIRRQKSGQDQPIQFIHSPTYIIQGNADEKVIRKVTKQSQNDFEGRMKEYTGKKQRLSLNPV